MTTPDWAQLVYLLMALLLVAGAGFGFRRLRRDSRMVWIGIVFWAALIVVIVMAYTWFN